MRSVQLAVLDMVRYYVLLGVLATTSAVSIVTSNYLNMRARIIILFYIYFINILFKTRKLTAEAAWLIA